MSELFIETRGDGGRHIVLLHGWAMHGGVFGPLIEALSRCATVHVVDLPGHGHSRDSTLALTPDACAAAIAAATPPAIWLGWSLGGLIALQGALDHNDQVQALVMTCASPCFVRKDDWSFGMTRDVFTTFGRELDHDYHATLDRFLALEAMGSGKARADMQRLRKEVFARGEPNKRVLKEGLEVLENTDLRARVANLACPSAWIAGSRDRLVPWRGMQWGAQQAAGRFSAVEHAGHAPFIGFTDQVTATIQATIDPTDTQRKQA